MKKNILVILILLFLHQVSSAQHTISIGIDLARDDYTFSTNYVREMPSLNLEYRQVFFKRWSLSSRFSHFAARGETAFLIRPVGGNNIDEQLILSSDIDNPFAIEEDYSVFNNTGIKPLSGNSYTRTVYIWDVGIGFNILNLEKHKLNLRLSGNITYESLSYINNDNSGFVTREGDLVGQAVILGSYLQNRAFQLGNGIHIAYEFHPNDKMFFAISHGGYNNYLSVTNLGGFYTLLGGRIGIKF